MNTIYVHSLIRFTIAIFRGCRPSLLLRIVLLLPLSPLLSGGAFGAAGAASAAGVASVAPRTHQPMPDHLIVM